MRVPKRQSRRPASTRPPATGGDGYLTVDTMALRSDALRRDNAAALLAGLCNPALERVPAQAAALRARLDAPELRSLLETVLAWVQHVAKRHIGLDLGIEDMADVDRLHESGELEAFFAARRRAYEDRYRAEGVARGICCIPRSFVWGFPE